jgi:putative DNA primase/helicase
LPVPDSRIILVTAGAIPRLIAEAESALLTAQSAVYQRGGELVRIARLDSDTTMSGVRRPAGGLIITPVTPDWLLYELSRVARWAVPDDEDERIIDPPMSVVRSLLALSGLWRLPVLRGLITAPTLRADGSLIERDGYDAQSGLYADFGGIEYPPINPTPSLEEARAALLVLDDLLSECAFSGGPQSPSASVMRAAIITAIIRHALDLAPILAVTAEKAGSGKTTLAHIISLILTGHPAAVVPLGTDNAEIARQLLGLLMTGDQVVCFDNAVKPVDSPALCAATTSSMYRDRMIRTSQVARVSAAVTWVITGNHLSLVGDMSTRAVQSTLDPPDERPQERAYRRRIEAHITAHRAQLVQAALTIPLAYLAAGAPALPVRPSRFHEWDHLVRHPLLWLGCADPIETQRALEEADTERQALRVLLAAWVAVLGDRAVTVADLRRAALAKASEALMDALPEVALVRPGQINARRLGNYLVERVGQAVDGMQIKDAGEDKHAKTRRYRVVVEPLGASG